MPARRLLDATELFAALPGAVVEELGELVEERSFTRGDLVFRQGDPSESLYVVLEGRVAISTRSSDGRESVVAVLEAGGLFGELGVFDGEPRSADVRALTDCTLAALAYDHVRRAIDDRPEILRTIVRLLAQRLRATDEALADAVFLDVPARTAKRLLELAGDQDDFRIPLTQEELAGLVGASRERVNKAIALFTRLGWLETLGRGRYRILDRESMTFRARA
ncbi:MAG: Crp/Fnr family transcriptional regulator [Acidimicrobiia bacterium]|nr:Crp/Fnr family transcriptional regulator [Acidimicrobiia bacterium]MCL4291880.1 Crp/Fnr family transcriptional regulator [Acidimicrobiia bacterium]